MMYECKTVVSRRKEFACIHLYLSFNLSNDALSSEANGLFHEAALNIYANSPNAAAACHRTQISSPWHERNI